MINIYNEWRTERERSPGSVITKKERTDTVLPGFPQMLNCELFLESNQAKKTNK